ncbi:type 2 isopentenyl-diphosphate Delta-isomerase [Listeria grandensis]|uniref:Isopentenyl-diphosphate delta-isomerase n=1 Tax=Listeria grandensis TaxID=1494963 RepID=A0A7X1CNJ7_9LIST|nr:type 2 isopentenyl-diphosphate Delta-isomerase [Listeria grandensis]MBC1935003.1 type 2 isopentenyl-diphosphate Delta-isomerase [Listeria grandensis]
MEDQHRSRRKDEHITLAYGQFDEGMTSFADVRFVPQPIPHFHTDSVSLQTEFANQRFELPFYINAMTGGSTRTKQVNQSLAIIARETGIAVAVGSQSAALQDPDMIDTYSIVRKENPTGKIFANLSANNSVDSARKAVEMLEANALQIHINVAQELVMKEGDRDFSNWLEAIQEIVALHEFPVIVKEVGFGMSRELMEQLQNVGVKTLDVGGKGGTNFAKIESDRRRDGAYRYLEDWGLTTAESLLDCQNSSLEILASGGIKTPLDIVKCLALGAKSVGISGVVLHQLKRTDVETTIHMLQNWQGELRSIMTLLGAKGVPELAQKAILIEGDLKHFAKLRHVPTDHLANRT